MAVFLYLTDKSLEWVLYDLGAGLEEIMSKRWYVVHAYSGFEKSVMRAIQERIDRLGMQEKFGRILVPVEEVVEMKGGQKAISERKFFPGYVLCRNGNGRRLLASGQEHAEGYRLCWRHGNQADADFPEGSRQDHAADAGRG
jgi:hypothetical protein